MMREVSIRECDKESLRRFDCGEEKLNEFLYAYAKQNDEKGLGRTFVLKDESDILGYYTLASAQIEFEHLPDGLSKRLPRYPAPAIRLARLAVAKSRQGQGIGKALLKCALKRIMLVSVNAGVAFIIVDAKENAFGFYEKYGFVRLEKEGNVIALPVASLLKAIIDK